MLNVGEFDEPQLIGQYLSRYGKVWPHVTAFIIERDETALPPSSPHAFPSPACPKADSASQSQRCRPDASPPPVSFREDEDTVRKSEAKLAWAELISRNKRNAMSVSDALFRPEDSSHPPNDEDDERKPIFEPIYKRSAPSKCSRKHPNDAKSLLHLRRSCSVPIPEPPHRIVKFKIDDSISHASENIFPRIDLPPHYPHSKKKKSGLSMLLKNEADDNVQSDNEKGLLTLEVKVDMFSFATRVSVPLESRAQDVIVALLKQLNETFSYPVSNSSLFELYTADVEGNKLLTVLDLNDPIGKWENPSFRLRKKLHTSLSLPH